MPIYEYRCRNGHEFEIFQRMSEEPISRCGECGAPVERVFHPVAVHFKGSGFYTTDYARSAASSDGSSESDAKGKGPDAGKEAKKKGSGEKKAKAEETA
jgi:putative FmdB family regulatory protein